MQTGVYWQYVPNADVFYCPVDRLAVGTGTSTTGWDGRQQKLSSYVMNGAAAFFPPLGNASLYQYRTCKLSQVWSSMCYIQWEGNPANDYTYNDGANCPNMNEGVGPMHSNGKGCNVLAIAGNASMMKISDFEGLEYGGTYWLLKGPPNLFHWNIMTPNGAGIGESLP